MERVVLLSRSDEVSVNDLPEKIRHGASRQQEPEQMPGPRVGIHLKTMERDLILQVLRSSDWNQSEAARQLGISRNSLREAVKSLESLGVLEARTGVGLFVRGFSFDPLLENLAYGLRIGTKDLRDIFEIRYHLEYGMAERAVQAVTAEQIGHLRKILERMHVEADAGRYSAEDDRAFHQALWENVDNTILGKLLDIFWMIREQAQQSEFILEPPDPLTTYQRHVSIVEALEQRSVEALRAAITYERLHKQASTPLQARKPPLEVIGEETEKSDGARPESSNVAQRGG